MPMTSKKNVHLRRNAIGHNYYRKLNDMKTYY